MTTVQEINEAVQNLSIEDKKAFVLAALPQLGAELAKEPGFLGQLLPIFLNMVKESGIDMQQMLAMAQIMAEPQS